MKIVLKNESENEENAERLISVNSKIPKLFQNAWLEDCDKKIKEWSVSEKKDDKQGLYIYGSCGTGKTHALYSLYRNSMFTRNATIKNVIELLRLFKKDFKDDYSNNFDHYLEYKGILMIDDIGSEKNSEFVDETLYFLINKRCEGCLPTLFTSNLSLTELAKKNGDRLVSRITGMCEIIKLEGKDKRLK